MRKTLSVAVGVVALLLAENFASQAQKPGSAAGEQEKVMEVTARKYAYTPREIHVEKGTRVQLKVRAMDRTHGFKITLYPEGAAESGSPGLRFDQPQESWKLEKGAERVIEFVAERPGTYVFRCSLYCGLGHLRMKGKLVVEE